MPKAKTATPTVTTFAHLNSELEALMRRYVIAWIQQGAPTYDMRVGADNVRGIAHDFLIRDIRDFGETGKYPQG